MLRTYSSIIDKIEKVVSWVSIVLMFVGFLVIFLQAVARYFFHTGAAWMEETGRYCIIYLSFLCAPVAIRHGRHMAIDVFESRFATVPRIILHIFFDILLLWFFAMMTRSGWVYSLSNLNNISVAIRISMTYIYMSCTVGFFLMILFQIESLWINIIKLREQLSKKREGDN